jgi:hypothetical protein
MASAQVTITQLPAAGPITGNESVPIVQNGQTVQTTTGAIAVQPTQTQSFLTATNTPSLANSRTLAAGSGLSLTDGGAQGTMQVNITGAASSLNAAGNGFMVKTGISTLVPREIQVGTGLGITNGTGVAGNPVIDLGSFLASIQSLSGSTGLVSVNGGAATSRSIAGTSNQISVSNGDASAGNPTVALASNPILPGAGGAQFPAGTTAQRPLGVTNGTFRYNTDNSTFEGYANNAWGAIALGGGVTSVGLALPADFTITNSPVTSTGTLTGAWAAQTTNKVLASPNGSTGTPTFRALANDDLPASGVAASTYGSTTQIPVITVNAKGVLTAVTNTTIIGTLSYQGGWNASTNTPTLTSSVGVAGYYYVVTTAGSTNLNGITDWQVGDWVIYNGSVWQKIDQTNTVSSVNGQTGAVSIAYADLAGAIPTWNQNTTGTAAGLSSTLAIGSGGTGQTTASAAFNALSPITTTGDLIIGNGTNSATRLGIGTNGYILTSNGTTATWTAAPASGVTSFAGGTTGLTPATATTGAITLAGTLVVGNGGTGVATLTGLAYGNGTSAFTAATGSEVVAVIGSTAVTNATNATNVATTATSTNSDFFIPFVAASTTGNQALGVDAGITYNPSTNALTASINGGTF